MDKQLRKLNPDELFNDKDWFSIKEIALLEGCALKSVWARCPKKVYKENDTLRRSVKRVGGQWKIDRIVYGMGFRDLPERIERAREKLRKEKEAWEEWNRIRQSSAS